MLPGSRTKGRGALVSFLSKKTIAKLLKICSDSIRRCIVPSGVHSGLQAEIRRASPESVYIHCYGHVLNLVMSKCTSDSGDSRKLFGLLTSTAVFMSQFHKRMDIWRETIPGSHWKLQKIGETRWWSKDVALKNVFGSYESPNPERLATLLKALRLIESSNHLIQRPPLKHQHFDRARRSSKQYYVHLCF